MRSIVSKLARLVYRRLMPRRAKNTLRLWLLYEEQDKPPEPIRDFSEPRVMVLAPHMDDEVVGCGGAIRQHVLSGAQITVVSLTDGRRGDHTLYGRDLSTGALDRAEHALSSERKQESRHAADILGYDDLVFLDAPDGQLELEPQLIERLVQLIGQRRPQLIYLPSPLERHPDHWMTSCVFDAAFKSAPELFHANLLCRTYEAWTPLLPNRFVDITDVFEDKILALRAFASQLRHVDYERVTRGLNMYRSINQNGSGYVEAFFECTPAQHAALLDRKRSQP